MGTYLGFLSGLLIVVLPLFALERCVRDIARFPRGVTT